MLNIAYYCEVFWCLFFIIDKVQLIIMFFFFFGFRITELYLKCPTKKNLECMIVDARRIIDTYLIGDMCLVLKLLVLILHAIENGIKINRTSNFRIIKN